MQRVIQPDGWQPAKGYANGILAKDKFLFVGGQIGWNQDQVFESQDFIDQMKWSLRNIVAVVEKSGGQLQNIVRLTWFVIDKKEYIKRQQEIGIAYQQIMGKHYPAMSMLVVSELIEDEALLEIEATAVLN